MGLPQTTAWSRFTDLEGLAQCIPGVSDVRVIEPGRVCDATITDKVGPFLVQAKVSARLDSLDMPRELLAALSGTDARTRTSLHGTLRGELHATGEDRTRVRMQASFAIVGPVATVASGVVRRRAEQIFDGFVSCIQRSMGETR